MYIYNELKVKKKTETTMSITVGTTINDVNNNDNYS